MKKNIWILLDNRIGSRHQAEGIADCLDKTRFTITEKTLEYNRWAALPNFIRGTTLLGLVSESKNTISAPYPDIVLSPTRRTAPIARYIKKKHPETKLVQLGHIGRTGIKDLTFIFAPEHDKNKLMPLTFIILLAVRILSLVKNLIVHTKNGMTNFQLCRIRIRR